MKKKLLIFFLSSLLFAKNTESCYSVQLKSFYLKKNSTYNFEKAGYPHNCKLIKFSKIYSVRCGCFDRYAQAQRELDKLSDRYYDAMIVKTYKYRFLKEIKQTSNNKENSDYDNSLKDKYKDKLDAYLVKKIRESKIKLTY